VVDDQEVSLCGDGLLEQLSACAYAGGKLGDLVASWDLEAVGAVVLEAVRFQEAVQLGDGFVQVAGHRARLAVRGLGMGIGWLACLERLACARGMRDGSVV
jgi:hypothetical protein